MTAYANAVESTLKEYVGAFLYLGDPFGLLHAKKILCTGDIEQRFKKQSQTNQLLADEIKVCNSVEAERDKAILRRQQAIHEVRILRGILPVSDNYIEQFKGVEAGPLIQFVKYGISGGFATFVHILIFHLVAWKIFPSLQEDDFFIVIFGMTTSEVDVATRSLNSMLSNGVAFVCSNLVAYTINIFWVFTPGRHKRFIEIGLFYLVSGISVVIGTSMMGFLIRYYGMQTTYAFSVNILSAVMINYIVRKFYIFKG